MALALLTTITTFSPESPPEMTENVSPCAFALQAFLEMRRMPGSPNSNLAHRNRTWAEELEAGRHLPSGPPLTPDDCLEMLRVLPDPTSPKK